MIIDGIQKVVRRLMGSKRSSFCDPDLFCHEMLSNTHSVNESDSGNNASSFQLLFQNYLVSNMRIADLGSGPSGAFWWDLLPAGCQIEAFDLFNTPNKKRFFVAFHREDVTELYQNLDFYQNFDLVVADHIFEHVAKPPDLARSIAHIIKPGGLLHVGIPDASNFTDRFYRLIHPDGGGHISQFTRESFLALIKMHGFELLNDKPWPDDWRWFEFLYSLENYRVTNLTMDEKRWMADVFRRELTLEKGYFYGWEFLLHNIR